MEVTTGDVDTVGTSIWVNQDGVSAVTVTANANIDSDKSRGIVVDTVQQTICNITIIAKGNVNTEGSGMQVAQYGTGSIDITANGNITSDVQQGIEVSTRTRATGDVTITTNGDVTGTGGISITHQGSGEILVTVNGEITGKTSAAIGFSGSSTANARIVMRDGARINGSIHVEDFAGTTTLEFAGEFTDFNFGNHNVDLGNNIFGIDSIIISESGSLEFETSSPTAAVPITLSGRLALIGASSTVNFGAITTSGNTDSIEIDVDFSGGSATLTTARLTATSVTGTIPVHIRAINGVDPTQEVTITNLIDIADGDAFAEGTALNGGFTFDLQYEASNTRWNLVTAHAATGDGGNGDDGGGDNGNGDGGGGSGTGDNGDGGGNGGGNDERNGGLPAAASLSRGLAEPYH